MKKIVPFYPWPLHPKVESLVAEIENIRPVQALPGGPGPVVAIGKTPDFVCDAIVVKGPEHFAAAVRIALGDGLELVTVRDAVSAILGHGEQLTERYEENDHRGVRFE